MKNKLDSTTELCDCTNEIECLRHMFCDIVQRNRVENQNQCPARRPVFLRTHGIIRGKISFLPNIPRELQHGIFSNPGKVFDIVARYSSDINDTKPDYLSSVGLGLKIFYPDKNKIEPYGSLNTADFLFQNMPNFFVDTAKLMCGFTKASLQGVSDDWIEKNSPKTAEILKEMEKPVLSVFDESQWSIVPFQLGENNFCKYIIRTNFSENVEKPDVTDQHFLGKNLKEKLRKGPARLDFYIQKRPSIESHEANYVSENFPLDQATFVWNEKEAIPIKVATIDLPAQEILEETMIFGDWLAFNIGRVPPENKPIGSIALARMTIYETSADYRRHVNQQPIIEPISTTKPIISNPVCPFPHFKKNS
jgi:hypothetical protein